LRVIPPLAITDGMLTSSTAAEPGPGETAWNAATNYSVGDQVYLASNHTRYEALEAGVDATSPPDNPTKWLELGPTNRWAMFDLLRNTGTVADSPLTVVITPGVRVNSVALVGLVADEVTITVENDEVEVYSVTEDLSTREVVDWYDYLFEPFSTRPSVAHFDMPPYTTAVITVTITRNSGDVTCGGLIMGTSIWLGETQQQAESDALNFSTIDRDFAGTVTLVPRRTIPKTNQIVVAPKSLVNRIIDARTDLNAVPALWSWLVDQFDLYFDAGLILGIYRRFTVTMDQPAPEYATLALELEEV
jgi:hypothetical protein